MSVTYDPTLTTDRDKIRLLIQDTSISSAFLQDEEIDGMLSIYGSFRTTSVACCEVLASKFAADADNKRIGKLAIELRGRSERYIALANTLRNQTLKFAIPYAGGISRADKNANEQNSDTIKPSFKRHLKVNKNAAFEDGFNT